MRIFVFFLLTIVSCSPLIKYEDTAEKWENEIVKLEKLDSSQDYTKNQILFIGSSSIRIKEVQIFKKKSGIHNTLNPSDQFQ